MNIDPVSSTPPPPPEESLGGIVPPSVTSAALPPDVTFSVPPTGTLPVEFFTFGAPRIDLSWRNLFSNVVLEATASRYAFIENRRAFNAQVREARLDLILSGESQRELINRANTLEQEIDVLNEDINSATGERKDQLIAQRDNKQAERNAVGELIDGATNFFIFLFGTSFVAAFVNFFSGDSPVQELDQDEILNRQLQAVNESRMREEEVPEREPQPTGGAAPNVGLTTALPQGDSPEGTNIADTVLVSGKETLDNAAVQVTDATDIARSIVDPQLPAVILTERLGIGKVVRQLRAQLGIPPEGNLDPNATSTIVPKLEEGEGAEGAGEGEESGQAEGVEGAEGSGEEGEGTGGAEGSEGSAGSAGTGEEGEAVQGSTQQPPPQNVQAAPPPREQITFTLDNRQVTVPVLPAPERLDFTSPRAVLDSIFTDALRRQSIENERLSLIEDATIQASLNAPSSSDFRRLDDISSGELRAIAAQEAVDFFLDQEAQLADRAPDQLVVNDFFLQRLGEFSDLSDEDKETIAVALNLIRRQFALQVAETLLNDVERDGANGRVETKELRLVIETRRKEVGIEIREIEDNTAIGDFFSRYKQAFDAVALSLDKQLVDFILDPGVALASSYGFTQGKLAGTADDSKGVGNILTG